MASPLIDSDTICAISTPPGAGGIAVIRVSGPDAINIANKSWRGKRLDVVPSHTAHFGTIVNSDETILDEAVATVFRSPRSFTGEDTVEISVHGSRWIQREVLALLIRNGARMARNGEFTLRAYASGRIDLAEAEGIADLIAASSRAAHRAAINQMRGGISAKLKDLREKLINISALLELELDFSEEDVEFASRKSLTALAMEIETEIKTLHSSFRSGTAIKEGIPVAIVGPTNAGKSSLLNALLGDERAIVSDIHGTTRDAVEDTLELGDFLFRFIDTAGIRHTDNRVEQMGIERSIKAMKSASIVLLISDMGATVRPEAYAEIADQIPKDAVVIRVDNKADIAKAAPSENGVAVSALTGQGISKLKDKIVQAAGQLLPSSSEDTVLITNIRHAEALAQAGDNVKSLLRGLNDRGFPTVLLAQDLRQTISHLATITGTESITTTDVFTTIFSRFCIGK